MKNLHVYILIFSMALASLLSPKIVLADGETNFVPIEPCRIFDTRYGAPGRFAGGGQEASFYAIGSGLDFQGGEVAGCGIPDTATAMHINFTAVNPGGFGYLRAWPYGFDEPSATLMAWYEGKSISNATAMAINYSTFDFTVKVYLAGTDLVGDVVGYYVPVQLP